MKEMIIERKIYTFFKYSSYIFIPFGIYSIIYNTIILLRHTGKFIDLFEVIECSVGVFTIIFTYFLNIKLRNEKIFYYPVTFFYTFISLATIYFGGYYYPVPILGFIFSILMFYLIEPDQKARKYYLFISTSIMGIISLLQGIKRIPMNYGEFYTSPTDVAIIIVVVLFLFYALNLFNSFSDKNVEAYYNSLLKKGEKEQKKLQKETDELKAIKNDTKVGIKNLEENRRAIKTILKKYNLSLIDRKLVENYFKMNNALHSFIESRLSDEKSKTNDKYYSTNYYINLKKDAQSLKIESEQKTAIIKLNRVQTLIILMLIKKLKKDIPDKRIKDKYKGYISKEKLEEKLFGYSVKKDNKLNTHISSIRKLLRENKLRQDLIETIKGTRSAKGKIRLSTSASYHDICVE